MFNLIRITFLALLMSAGDSYGQFGQNNLPACPSSGYFHNCFGTVTHFNGDKYVGEYKDNKRNGQFTGTFANGDKYVGEFKDDTIEGQGTYTFANGDKYVGEYKDNMMNGQGIYTFANGNKYDGEFRDHKFNGKGTFTEANGDKYVGEFKDDKLDGKATLTKANGDKYVGEFKDGKHNGQGTVTKANGDKYVGEFKDGKYNGQGIYTFANGDKYAGEYKDGQLDGKGTVTKANGDKYVGEFKDGKYNGQGIYTFANGNKYDGEFRDFKFNGKGTFTVANGDKYVGEFKDGKFNGQGTSYAANGSMTNQGIWANGSIVIPAPLPQATAPNQEVERLRAEAGEAKRKQAEAEAELRLAQQQALEVEESKRKQAELQEQLLVAQQQSNQLTSTSSTQALALNENSIRNAHALIIGNSAYIGGGRLPNPVNDARLMASKLRTMGFKVTIVEDANRIKLVSALGQFNRSAATADLTLFFYSGHGVQIFGTNYILPVDLDQSDLAQATLQGISLNSIVEQFMPGKTKLVFLDACRTNPLAVASARGFSKGLAPISASEGTLIAYAAKDGQEAADGVVGKNSPFTSALVAHLSDPDDIAVVLRKVRSDVMKNTAGKQQPWDYGSLTGGALVLSAIKPK